MPQITVTGARVKALGSRDTAYDMRDGKRKGFRVGAAGKTTVAFETGSGCGDP